MNRNRHACRNRVASKHRQAAGNELHKPPPQRRGVIRELDDTSPASRATGIGCREAQVSLERSALRLLRSRQRGIRVTAKNTDRKSRPVHVQERLVMTTSPKSAW